MGSKVERKKTDNIRAMFDNDISNDSQMPPDYHIQVLFNALFNDGELTPLESSKSPLSSRSGSKELILNDIFHLEVTRPQDLKDPVLNKTIQRHGNNLLRSHIKLN